MEAVYVLIFVAGLVLATIVALSKPSSGRNQTAPLSWGCYLLAFSFLALVAGGVVHGTGPAAAAVLIPVLSGMILRLATPRRVPAPAPMPQPRYRDPDQGTVVRPRSAKDNARYDKITRKVIRTRAVDPADFTDTIDYLKWTDRVHGTAPGDPSWTDLEDGIYAFHLASPGGSHAGYDEVRALRGR